jgi:hypothetical protein
MGREQEEACAKAASPKQPINFGETGRAPIYLASFNLRVLLSVGVDANDQNLLQRGALL